MRDTVLTVIRQRLSLHEHPEAVADALSAVPRSRPFGAVAELADDRRSRRPWSRAATRPTPSTRRRSGRPTPRRSPEPELVLDEPGRSPIAWQGSQLSRVIAELAARGA